MESDKLLHYFNGDELAANVWQSKYALEGEETPDDMHKRLAKEFGRIEDSYVKKEKDINWQNLSEYGKNRERLTYEVIYNLFKDFKYIIPQGSVMSQLGAKSIGSLSNCFVIGQPEDSYGGIFRKDEEMVQLMKRRGGVGIDISTLRPAETTVSNAAKTTTGAVSFMHRFSNSTREVAQNGRRGALMISMNINHPDIMDFIKIKRDGTSVTGANISIKINNEFMKAVENDEDYILRFPCDLPLEDKFVLPELEYHKLTTTEYYPGSKKLYLKKIRAKEYWDEIIKSAHGYAEPGIIFVDNHHNYSPDGVYSQYKGVTTNPCGEIFMQPYDACRLIAVNLFSFVNNPFREDAGFDFEKFYEINYEAMRLSDDLIDLEIEHIDRIIAKLENDPESEIIKWTEIDLWYKIKETAQISRRTGLGFTALGDCLAALNFKYDSQEALEFVEQFMHVKMESELDCTVDLAILRGSFEGWDSSLEFKTIQKMSGESLSGTNEFYNTIAWQFDDQANKMIKYGRRNISWSTVAPTGSVSILTATTSGLEPLFMPFYMRRKKVNDSEERVDFVDEIGDKWQEFPVLHPKFKDWIEMNYQSLGVSYIINEISKEELQECFEKSPWYDSTANDINWINRVKLQGIIQKYITHSISSTINLPNNVTEEEVAEIYFEAWKKGLKGITVYRDGSRSGVLVSNSEANKSRDDFNYIDAVKRPKELEGEIHHTKINKLSYYIVVGLLNGKPYEIFIENDIPCSGRGKIVKLSKGKYEFRNNECTHLITASMSDEQVAITRLTSTSLRHGADIKFVVEQLNKCDGDLFSFTKALARVLKKYIPDGVKSTVTCDNCGSSQVIFQEGCQTCQSCGSSKCS